MGKMDRLIWFLAQNMFEIILKKKKVKKKNTFKCFLAFCFSHGTETDCQLVGFLQVLWFPPPSLASALINA